ncbi:hypothetical protein HY68_36510 [Streptomyces sp. AcH 505]|uniref:hypothetical protein n=1 Tax=Streptomyces sp. AcH 505 TaxID=352211 RepID=UPI0005918CE0|nr:hypothetical protein HY68_36510 [Streptomyces sp. AcH 505]
MIREDRFLISRKPFAIGLSSVTMESAHRHDAYWLDGTCLAVWFRRKNGITYACLGTLGLWAHRLREEPDVSSPEAILSNSLDSRYGGDPHGRWDGERYWGSQKPVEQALHLTLLEPMLANYPDLPAGYDGWWRF